MAQNYFAFIGDIVSSRKCADRYALQQRFNSALAKINADFSDSIAADFLVTLGDEFQGLVKAENGALPILIASRIIAALHPERIRISIGFGAIDTPIRREAALGADGPCYHKARAGIETIRASERKSASRILFTSGDKATDSTVNTLLLLLSAVENGFSSRQNSAAQLYIDNLFFKRELTQTELAAKMGITQSTYNTSLSSSNAREYAQGLLECEKLLLKYKV